MGVDLPQGFTLIHSAEKDCWWGGVAMGVLLVEQWHNIPQCLAVHWPYCSVCSISAARDETASVR